MIRVICAVPLKKKKKTPTNLKKKVFNAGDLSFKTTSWEKISTITVLLQLLFLPVVVVSRGAVRLPAESVVPLVVSPSAPVDCKPLVAELPPAWGAEGLELTAWLVNDEDRV